MSLSRSSSSAAQPEADDAFLMAAQQAFRSSKTQPAAKIIRTSQQEPTKSQNSPEQVESSQSSRGWYQQMKGVRFRLDDLESSDDEGVKPRPQARRNVVEETESRDNSLGVGAVMGDIVERKVSASPPVFVSAGGLRPRTDGFPAPRRFGRAQKAKDLPSSLPVKEYSDKEKDENRLEGKELMEEIDRENRKKMAEMSEEEILELQQSLRATLPKNLQAKLLQKSPDLTSNEMSSDLPRSIVPRPSDPPAKSKASGPPMHDKSFDEHLRTFFPATTTSVGQPEWTLPVHPAEETFYAPPNNSTPEANTMRFDFKGHFITPETSRSLPTHLGLHHHSIDPGAAGYTLAELGILARSVQPSQKCIALKIIGFVLADVAKGLYPWDVTEGLWDEIEQERIIEILLDVAKGGQESGGNRSVQRYAEDAVKRWVNANGPKLWEERLQRKGYEKVD